MPVKKYGIYLAYPPTADLRAEGLGRHLAQFLKGGQERSDVRFVIACPSWMRENLVQLFAEFDIPEGGFELVCPRRKPLLLSAYQCYIAFRDRPKRRGRLHGLLKKFAGIGSALRGGAEKILVSTRSTVLMTILLVMLSCFIAVGFIAKAMAAPFILGRVLTRRTNSVLASHPAVRKFRARANVLAARPKDDTLAHRLYRAMEESEAVLMRALIDGRKDIAAWYSPTAFWPHFNDISAPRLMCVPDVVLANFPVGFAHVGGSRFFDNFRQVEKAIDGSQYFVTYSQDVKWRMLVERYHSDPASISVIPHGASRLDEAIVVSGFPDNDAAANALCRNFFRTALRKAVNNHYAAIFGSNDMRFIFYASQFRPNKNVISLLRAYEYLLKRRYVSHKLVLTGDPNVMPEIAAFIAEHCLENDVLFLYRLSLQELAACYRLADLAVNPSLSEGGCPFTFTEALSVGTPAVMARLAVTEEIITCPALRELMLFDPYDWKDIAQRIEWGLKNQQLLLEKQTQFYDRLAQRTWRHVVDDTLAILDRISGQREVARQEMNR